MLTCVIFLLFLYGIKDGSTQQQTSDLKEVSKNGIKKNEFGANGLDNKPDDVLKNFRNPVLEYLLHKNSDKASGPLRKGIVREICHSQTLLLPNFPGGFSPNLLDRFQPVSLPAWIKNLTACIASSSSSSDRENEIPGVREIPLPNKEKKPNGESNKNPEDSSSNNFWNFIKNKSESGGNKTHESIVTSPVLHLNKNPNPNREESTRIEVYPAMAVVVNTFDKEGTLKNSITHFQPDFNSFKTETKRKEASYVGNADNNFKNIQNPQHTLNNFLGDAAFPGGAPERPKDRLRQGQVPWPFASYFPIVINNPYLYNAFATSMYNAVSSVVEYGPEADICRKDKTYQDEVEGNDRPNQSSAAFDSNRKKDDELEEVDPEFFDEVMMGSESSKRVNKKPAKIERQNLKRTPERKRRDASSIFLKTRRGDKIDITLEERSSGIDAIPSSHDEKARSFSPVLVNTPPLSTILRPPHQESRQFLGYADKKRKAKPSKPMKEEGSNEEVGEEQEEESSSQVQETNESVAISPPPEGASVAEAKPIGLAIAGPGGVAASKPQGTAVAGPGGLAIARPVGTAIAGVDVEGSVPIGGQQKNKKKPKQEQEQTETELHYVGGLTGPIGNPKPKEFADRLFYKAAKKSQGNNVQDNNLFFRGRHNSNGFQFQLGQQDGKYGFIPMFGSPVPGSDRLQKRMDSPAFFHGLLGNADEGNDQFHNYQMHY